jgi:hypothetical protein
VSRRGAKLIVLVLAGGVVFAIVAGLAVSGLTSRKTTPNRLSARTSRPQYVVGAWAKITGRAPGKGQIVVYRATVNGWYKLRTTVRSATSGRFATSVPVVRKEELLRFAYRDDRGKETTAEILVRTSPDTTPPQLTLTPELRGVLVRAKDDSFKSFVDIRMFHGGKVLDEWPDLVLGPSDAVYAAAPLTLTLSYRFCAIALDVSGNRARQCAWVSLKRRKR